MPSGRDATSGLRRGVPVAAETARHVMIPGPILWPQCCLIRSTARSCARTLMKAPQMAFRNYQASPGGANGHRNSTPFLRKTRLGATLAATATSLSAIQIP